MSTPARDSEMLPEIEPSSKEAIDPGLPQLGGQTQRQKRRQRLASHGRDVAQPARQTAMPNRLWRVPLAAKVHALQAEIGCDQRVVMVRNSKKRAIVANPGRNSSANRGLRFPLG